MFSRFALELVTRYVPGTSDPLAAPSPWYVLTDLTVARATAESFLAEAFAQGLVSDAVLAGSAAQAKALWKLRESISESQKHEGGSIKHDISVPVSRIPAFMHQALAAAKKLIPGIRPVPFGHVGDGNLPQLLKKTFEIDTVCPRCKTPLRLIAMIETEDTIKKILKAMGLPTCAPKLWPARPPPSQSGGEGGDWLN